MKVKIRRFLLVFLMTMGMLLSAMTVSAYQSEDMEGTAEVTFMEEEIQVEMPVIEETLVTESGMDSAAVEGTVPAEGEVNGTVGTEEHAADGNPPADESIDAGTGETPFSIPGNGLLLDDKSEDGTKQFLTIRTKKGNTFFMVLDRSNNTENVYMLSMIDEADLAEFIEDAAEKTKSEAPSLVIPQKEPILTDTGSTEKPGQDQTELEKKKATGMNTGTVFVLIVILAGGIGGFYYLKVVKPKREEEDAEVEELEFLDDGPYINEDEEPYEDDGEE